MESPYYEMAHDFEEENYIAERNFQSGYLKGYHDAVMKEQEHIIRCKDCRYWENEILRENHPSWLPCMHVQTRSDFYCADGEQKD